MGSRTPAVKPLGPVQLYDAPGISAADRRRVSPSHTGLLELTLGAGGMGCTVMVTVSEGADEHVPAVTTSQ